MFFSCANHIGYGVLTWSLPEYDLTAGDVVPVFIQSNISQVYVIGIGSRSKERIEVPLWQLSLYKSKSQAQKAAAGLEEYRYIYAMVKLDGLPIRAQPDNTARQVYRLRKDQKVKIIRKGEGVPVISGKAPLEGDWYEVMSDDGTTGWCFSYNLTLFDERDADAALKIIVDTGPDPVLDNLLAYTWYPDSYRTMIQNNRVDISRIQPQWGFYPGKTSGIARVETADGVVSFPYTGVTKMDNGAYRFEGTSLTVQVRRNNTILVQYADEIGMPVALYFARLDIAPEQLIENEQERRDAILAGIKNTGPRFVSGNYGVIQFLDDGRFLWSGYQLLTPAIIPAGAGGGGTVEVRYFLNSALAKDYNGVLSFLFDSTGRWVHFLYTIDSQGLRLEQVSESNIRNAVVTARNLTPTILFFRPEKAADEN
ncbi:SH3 domain-containing protein [Brucepastera parasyntrophica]|uniref:SH3 domain-containing protein n=1 Tax=Brucepastera parasyntrophica TaxID=2880008 RepID=UPI0021094A98|nr:SH3 domain-containing protein [Brucepastera parasyntrophica]ULQ60508.1 SH3 domain-containing protein [Brucepastera parasyntrophica]